MKEIYIFYIILLLVDFYIVLTKTNQVPNKQSYQPRWVVNSTSEVLDNNIMTSSSRQEKHKKVGVQIPKCKYTKQPR